MPISIRLQLKAKKTKQRIQSTYMDKEHIHKPKKTIGRKRKSKNMEIHA